MAVPAGSRQYSSFLELDDLKEWLQVDPANDDGSRDDSMQRILDAACTHVQKRLNRPASSQEFFERHDGWGGEYIMLLESPFLELVSAIEWQSSGGPITLVESTPENPVDGIQIDYLTGQIMRTFAGYSWPRTFFPGSRNIEITYMAGFNPTPPDVWLATMEFAAHWWRNSQTASRRAVVGGGETAKPSDAQAAGLWVGMPNRIQELLTDYRLPSVA